MNLAKECPSGISVLYHSDFDQERISYGWTILSSTSSMILFTGVVSRGFTPDVSSMKHTEIKALLHVVYNLLCVHQSFSIQDSKIDLYCLSTSAMRLACGLLYRSVSSALADHGDLLAELTFSFRKLCPISTINNHYLDISNSKSAPIPLQHIQTLDEDIESHRTLHEEPLPPQTYLHPPHNAVQLSYKNKPLLTRIKSTLRNDLYSSAIQQTICKQENWSATQFHDIDWPAHGYTFHGAWSTKK